MCKCWASRSATQITRFGRNPADQADGWMVDHIGCCARVLLKTFSISQCDAIWT
jgi:hypothetical protein